MCIYIIYEYQISLMFPAMHRQCFMNNSILVLVFVKLDRHIFLFQVIKQQKQKRCFFSMGEFKNFDFFAPKLYEHENIFGKEMFSTCQIICFWKPKMTKFFHLKNMKKRKTIARNIWLYRPSGVIFL